MEIKNCLTLSLADGNEIDVIISNFVDYCDYSNYKIIYPELIPTLEDSGYKVHNGWLKIPHFAKSLIRNQRPVFVNTKTDCP